MGFRKDSERVFSLTEFVVAENTACPDRPGDGTDHPLPRALKRKAPGYPGPNFGYLRRPSRAITAAYRA